MRTFLEIYNDYDLFYFGTEFNQQAACTELTKLNTKSNFINFFQASLQKNKFVIILRDKNIEMPNLMQLKASHFKIEHNQFIFLNFTLKNRIQKFRINEDSFDTFQELESFLLDNLSDNY